LKNTRKFALCRYALLIPIVFPGLVQGTQIQMPELFPPQIPEEVDFTELLALEEAKQAPEFVGERNPDRSKSLPSVDAEKLAGVVSASTDVAGPLTGKIVYLMAGHGWDYDSTGNVYATQRGETNEMIEDFGNLDQATIMAEFLLNAGATVVPTRPFGIQELEVVLDNDDATVTFSGAWSNSSATNFYGSAGDAVPYRFASAVSTAATATAVYNASTLIPQAGFYPVYVWTRSGSDRINQEYIITHPGGSVSRRINHRAVGSGWIYMGTYWFAPNQPASVTITNNEVSGDPGSVIIADAVRFGNGMGDAEADGLVSGHPRHEENGRYWLAESRGEGSGLTLSESVSSPARLAAYMNRSAEGADTDRVYLSFHSNAGGGRGADGLYNSNSSPASCSDPALANSLNTPNGVAYSQKLGTKVNTSMNSITSGALAPNPLTQTWGQSGAGTNLYGSGCSGFSAFGEINNTYFADEMAASLIEVAFHDSSLDAEILRDPRGREALARACLHATIDHFNAVSSTVLVYLPERPEAPRAISSVGGAVTLSWTAPVNGGLYGVGGGAPTGYIIESSVNGKSFVSALTINSGTTVTADVSSLIPVGETRFFRVLATNAGGASFPSPVVGARRSNGKASALIVNGFDRNGLSLNYRQTEAAYLGSRFAGGGTFDRVIPRHNNRYDYVADLGSALNTTGTAFDSCLNESIINGTVQLTDYDHVFWILGAESTADSTFNSTEQTLVTAFLANNGNLFLSGSEAGWDLGRTTASAGNKTFLQNTLRVVPFTTGNPEDDGNSYSVQSANPTGPFSGLGTLAFSDGSNIHGDFNVAFPDVLNPTGGAQRILSYVGGSAGSAGIYYNGNTTGNGRVVFLGFPLETLLSDNHKAALIQATMTEFNQSTSVESWNVYSY
jgi:N-acetylmuramoyl-L-alanine amidase